MGSLVKWNRWERSLELKNCRRRCHRNRYRLPHTANHHSVILQAMSAFLMPDPWQSFPASRSRRADPSAEPGAGQQSHAFPFHWFHCRDKDLKSRTLHPDCSTGISRRCCHRFHPVHDKESHALHAHHHSHIIKLCCLKSHNYYGDNLRRPKKHFIVIVRKKMRCQKKWMPVPGYLDSGFEIWLLLLPTLESHHHSYQGSCIWNHGSAQSWRSDCYLYLFLHA